MMTHLGFEMLSRPRWKSRRNSASIWVSLCTTSWKVGLVAGTEHGLKRSALTQQMVVGQCELKLLAQLEMACTQS